MTYNDCNERQKRAWKNIKHCASDICYGLLNTCMDNRPGDEDYDQAFATLSDLDGLIDFVYNESLTTLYTGGATMFGPAAEKSLRDIRYCGKEFLMKLAKYFTTKYRDEVMADLA